MNANDFRRIALGLDGAAHMGHADFRAGGKIFATLASQDQGYGNLKLTPDQQAMFVDELPEVFVSIAGGWGRMGMTHIRLAAASEDVLAGALRTAWKLRVDRNAKSGGKNRSPAARAGVVKPPRKKRWGNQTCRAMYKFHRPVHADRMLAVHLRSPIDSIQFREDACGNPALSAGRARTQA
jgi:hypothetical protein